MMRHTVETQKRGWHLWVALVLLLGLAWCEAEAPQEQPTYFSEGIR